MWKGRKLDAGGTQVRRSADAKQTQRDAIRTHRRSAKKHGPQEGHMTDADASISYSLTHKILIVFGSFVAWSRYTSIVAFLYF